MLHALFSNRLSHAYERPRTTHILEAKHAFKTEKKHFVTVHLFIYTQQYIATAVSENPHKIFICGFLVYQSTLRTIITPVRPKSVQLHFCT